MKGTLLAALTLATIITGTLGMTTFTPFHVSVMTVIYPLLQVFSVSILKPRLLQRAPPQPSHVN